MLTDSEIPVRVPGPFYIELVLEMKPRDHIRTAVQLVEDDAVVNALNSYFTTVAFVKQVLDHVS